MQSLGNTRNLRHVRITERTREERYADNWRSNFKEAYAPFLRDGITILDVGSGRSPAIPLAERPLGSTYIGLDISEEELGMAPLESYDRQYVADLRTFIPELQGTVDLIVSWQVLEHIEPLSDALENVRRYLKPSGAFVSMLSGRYAHFAIINRLIPESIGKWGMMVLLGRQPDTVFRAYYDRCTASGIFAMMDQHWISVVILPKYRGAVYLKFSKLVQALYLKYEDWAARGSHQELASHYILIARM